MYRRKSYILVNFKTWVSIDRLPKQSCPVFHKLIWHEPAIHTKSSTCSAVNFKKHVISISFKPKPAIRLRDTGPRISWYDSCQLNIVCMSNIKDICCNLRLHDLVLAGWPPCCATSFVVVRRRRRRWAHPPVINAASHFDHKKRVAWVPISMHTCGSFFYNYGAPLGGPPAISWLFI